MFALIKKWFSKPEESIPDMQKFLIAGLGNIGAGYAETRHNIGFKILDAFAQKHQVDWQSGRLASYAEVKLKGKMLLLIKPTTFMNLSGKAVNHWLKSEKISRENLLVITDDLNLPFGTIRMRGKGSHGGHNGLKDVESHLGGDQYNRYRFGIGDQFSKGRQVDYVLGEWNADEKTQLPERLDKSCELIESFVLSGMANTMNAFNGK